MRLKTSAHGPYLNRLAMAAVNSQYSGIQAADSQSTSPTGLQLSSTRIFRGAISQWLKQRRCFFAHVRRARNCIVGSEVGGMVQKNCVWKTFTESNGSAGPRSILWHQKEVPTKLHTLPSRGWDRALNCANQPRSVSPKTKNLLIWHWMKSSSVRWKRPTSDFGHQEKKYHNYPCKRPTRSV